MPRSSHGTYLWFAGVALLSAASAARAQLDTHAQDEKSSYPWYLGASLGRAHDSNVYRLPEFLGPRGDSYTTAAILAGLDKPFGRQRVYADLALRRQTFDDLGELNNNGYGLNAGLDWETVQQFSGQLSFSADKALASYGSPFVTTTASQERNILRERNFEFTIQHGTVANRLQPFAAFSTRNTEYSASSFRFRNNDRKALRAGLRWRPSDRLMLGAAWVEARGSYPFSLGTTGQGDDYKSHALQLIGDWTISGASSIDGRIGYEQRRYEPNSAAVPSRPDFSGINGLLRWRWQPTGKLMFTTSLVRDADDTERFVPTTGTDLTAAGSRITNSLLLEGTWHATAKISVNASYRYSDRNLIKPAGLQSITGNDKTRLASIGVSWAATNNVSAGCNLSRQSRSTDNLSVSYPFTANVVSCQVQALLR